MRPRGPSRQRSPWRSPATLVALLLLAGCPGEDPHPDPGFDPELDAAVWDVLLGR